MIRHHHRPLLRIPLVAACLFLSACRENPTGPGTGSETRPGADNPDWTETSHGDAAPDYGVVFPQDSTNVIEIRMSGEEWDSVRANMRLLWGTDFGTSPTGGPPPGFPSAEPDYVAVDVKFRGRQYRNVGYRLKGNSSLNSAWRQGNYKLPFRLNFDEFEDSIPTVHDQRMYGFEELSMSPGFADNSLIREKITADILRSAGIPAARTAFYRVYVDFGAGLKYCGVYTMVEVIDDTMVESQFGGDAGNIYKPESRLQTFVQSEFEIKNNRIAPDYADVRAFITALNSPVRATDRAQWRAGLESVFNIEHYLKWLAINNAIVNWDTYGAIAHNYYLYNDPVRKLTWIPWDHNQSLTGSPGITGTGGPPAPGGVRLGVSLSMNEVNQSWPLLRYVADDSVYIQKYRAYMKDFRENAFTEAAMSALADKYHAMIAPYVIGASGEQPGYSYIGNPAAFSAALPQLKQHIRDRRALTLQYVP